MRRIFPACVAVLVGAAPSFAEQVPVDEAPLDADVVFMGEVHDVSAHHTNQAAWIARMGASALVFEMLPEALGPVAEANWNQPSDILAKRLEWTARGWPDFDAYDPIFKASAGVDILGAEVPRDLLATAMQDGAAAAFGGNAANFGLDEPLPDDQRRSREAELSQAHCGLLPDAALPGMLEVQRLRDATLAARTLEAIDRTGGPVAVITGNGHARRDYGVPHLLGRARPSLGVVALGQFTEARNEAPFDAWVATSGDGAADSDPCDALR